MPRRVDQLTVLVPRDRRRLATGQATVQAQLGALFQLETTVRPAHSVQPHFHYTQHAYHYFSITIIFNTLG